MLYVYNMYNVYHTKINSKGTHRFAVIIVLINLFVPRSKALDMHVAVALLRIQEGLDSSPPIGDIEDPKKLAPTSIPGNQSFSQLSQGS